MSKCCKGNDFTALPFRLMGHWTRGFKEIPDTKGACSFMDDHLSQDINWAGIFSLSFFFFFASNTTVCTWSHM